MMVCKICKRKISYSNIALEDSDNCLDCDFQLRLEMHGIKGGIWKGLYMEWKP